MRMVRGILTVCIAVVLASCWRLFFPSIYEPDERGEKRVECPGESQLEEFGAWFDCWTMKKREVGKLIDLVSNRDRFAWDESKTVCREFTREEAIAAVGRSTGSDTWMWGNTSLAHLGVRPRGEEATVIRRYLSSIQKARTVIHEAQHFDDPELGHEEIARREACLIPGTVQEAPPSPPGAEVGRKRGRVGSRLTPPFRHPPPARSPSVSSPTSARSTLSSGYDGGPGRRPAPGSPAAPRSS